MAFLITKPLAGRNTPKSLAPVFAISTGYKRLFLGNLSETRLGLLPEYVEGMWRILQLSEGDDFVLATGETHSVREFVETAFSHVDLDWKEFVKHDARYQRPSEVDLLIGSPSKAKKILDWEPKVRFRELVRIMVDADMQLLSRETPREHLGKLP
jgi:GDPmannose 4,6-dehydratase